MYIRLFQQIQVFLIKRIVILIGLFLEGILKNTPGQILGNKAKKAALGFQLVQNIIYQKMQLL